MKLFHHYLIILMIGGILLSLSSLILAQSQSIPQDVTGWQGTRWGMTDTEIIKVFGSSVTRIEKRVTNQYGNVDLIIPAYFINNIKLRVSFRMDDAGKLKEVVLGDSKLSTIRDDTPFNELADLLTRKYGQCGRETNEPNETRTMVWNFPSTTIILSYSYVRTFGASSLGIRYISAKGGNENKL